MIIENYLLEFARDVKTLRDLQKAYFKTRDRDILLKAIAAEKVVDKKVKEILTITENEDKRQLTFNFNNNDEQKET